MRFCDLASGAFFTIVGLPSNRRFHKCDDEFHAVDEDFYTIAVRGDMEVEVSEAAKSAGGE